MKYPEHTTTQPLSSSEAKKVIRAIVEGRSVRTKRTAAVIKMVLAEYHRTKK
jgi:hypothetical protein